MIAHSSVDPAARSDSRSGSRSSVAQCAARASDRSASDSYPSIESFIAGEIDRSVHLECGRNASDRVLEAVQGVYATRRCAYFLESDRAQGFARETVRSYLNLFSRLAGGTVKAAAAIACFGLGDVASTRLGRLTADRHVLVNYARMSLIEPEVCYYECPLSDLNTDARDIVLHWMGKLSEEGTVFVTVNQPLREALLMPGTAWWEENGMVTPAQLANDVAYDGEVVGNGAAGDADGISDDGFGSEGEDIRICKIVAKSGEATLLFDPREIDFVESLRKSNYVSVRSKLYQTSQTMDELEGELGRFGFFRCHRSYIVNVQKVKRLERYTRNSFTLTLSDEACTAIPLAKGRLEDMRERYGLR